MIKTRDASGTDTGRHVRLTARVPPASTDPDIAELYSAGPPNIARALSSVPREALKFWDLMHRMYLVTPMAYELGDAKRDINRAQIELVASRASSVLGCFY